jgi:hypothetical protein
MSSLAWGAVVALFSVSAFAQGTLPVRDSDFGCISQAKADQYLRDFSVDTASFGGVELCNPQVDTKKLLNDLRLLEEGRFGNAVPNNLIRGFIPADQYYNWMKAQTRGIERGQDVPYATAYNSGGYFTMQDGWAELSTLGRVGTVVHEARHTQGYYHISCTQGPYIGTGVAGCDRDYQYGGSHAIEMEYYARVSVAGENFHPIYKKMARLMAMGRSNFVFNQTPLQQKETLMILTVSGRAYLLNNGSWIERETPNVRATLKRTSFGASLFTGTEAFVLDPYEQSGFNWSVSDDFSYFKLLKGSRNVGNADLQDFEEFDLGRKRYVVGLNVQQKMAGFNFRGGAWGSVTSAPAGAARFATWSPSGNQGLFILDQSKKVYSVDPERISQVRLTNEVWPSDVKNYVRATGGFFRLQDSGDLMQVASGKESRMETPEAVDQVVSVPLYDSFEVKP